MPFLKGNILYKVYLVTALIAFASTSAQTENLRIKGASLLLDEGKISESLGSLLFEIRALENNHQKNIHWLFDAYNLAGDIYYSNSDIGEAEKYWKKSLEINRSIHKRKEIFFAESYNQLAQLFSFNMKVDSAFYYASLAIDICRKNSGDLKLVGVHKIYRTYAVCLKARVDLENQFQARLDAKNYFDSAAYYKKKFFPNDLIFDVRILKDLGNIHTDLILYFRERVDGLKEVGNNLKLANLYYDKAIALLKSKFGEKHDLIADTYFTKGLSYAYIPRNDSLNMALSFYQKALCAATLDFNSNSIYDFPKSNSKFLNYPLVLTLFRFKLGTMYIIYENTKELKLLESIYAQSKASVEIWEQAFKTMRTEEIHKALETYGSSPFNGIIKFANTYYKVCKREVVKQNVIKWIGLNKYSAILKFEFERSRVLPTESINPNTLQSKLKDNQAIIEYYVADDQLICFTITKDATYLYENTPSFNLLHLCDSVLNYLKRHDAVKYCKESKILFDSLIAQYTLTFPSKINQLIICPHSKFGKLPFDALVTNHTNKYKSANFLIAKYKISYALSSYLYIKDSENKFVNRSMTLIYPSYSYHSLLPFSKKVFEELKTHFSIKNDLLETQDSASILQISAHGTFQENNSRNSYILINDTSKLRLKDVTKLKWPFKIAILTACETASGDIELGEGLINFNRNLYMSGIRSSITSLWKIDDQSTSEIIKSFYDYHLLDSTAITSLHLSKLKYLKNSQSVDDYDPFYWAGLIYTGKDLELVPEKTPISFNKVIFMLLLILGLLFFLIKFRT